MTVNSYLTKVSFNERDMTTFTGFESKVLSAINYASGVQLYITVLKNVVKFPVHAQNVPRLNPGTGFRDFSILCSLVVTSKKLSSLVVRVRFFMIFLRILMFYLPKCYLHTSHEEYTFCRFGVELNGTLVTQERLFINCNSLTIKHNILDIVRGYLPLHLLV
jgi:hypothetical protein